jgi:hypothetical protein
VDAAGLAALLKAKIVKQLDALWPKDAASLERFCQMMVPALRNTLAAKWPTPEEVDGVTTEAAAGPGSLARISVRHLGLPAQIELLAYAPAGEQRRASLLVASTDQEFESILQELRLFRSVPVRASEENVSRRHYGQAVFVLQFQPHDTEIASGGTEQQRRQFGPTYYRTALAWQVQDVLTALAYLTERAGFRDVRLAGFGEAGVPTLFARALEPTGKVSATIADLGGFDSQDEKIWTGSRTQPGILRLGGLTTAAILVAPGELILHNAGAHLDTAPIRAAYQAAVRDSALEVSDPLCSVNRILELIGLM